MGAGVDAHAVPAALVVEGFDEHQQAVFAGNEVAGQFGDLLAEVVVILP